MAVRIETHLAGCRDCCCAAMEHRWSELAALVDQMAAARVADLLGVTGRLATALAAAGPAARDPWLEKSREITGRDLAAVLHRELDAWERLLGEVRRMAERGCGRTPPPTRGGSHEGPTRCAPAGAP